MVKRILLLLLALLMLTGKGLADLKLHDSTPAQKMLKSYMTNVNSYLIENGEQEINTIFDQMNTVVEMGITYSDEALEPEGVSVTVYLKYDGIFYLLLRVNDAYRFPLIVGAFLRALNPKTMSQEESLRTPTEQAARAIKNPHDSFSEMQFDEYADKETQIFNGERPQTFYAYHPDQYHNGVNWLELMIVFPMAEYWDTEEGIITNPEETDPLYVEEGQDTAYEGYDPDPKYNAMQTYTTPTPEPDSAAMEYDDWAR